MAPSRPFQYRLGWIISLACCSMALLGCGPSLPPTYPVKGKVVNKKDKLAFKAGLITFQLTTDATVVADGAIGDDGSFTVTTKMHGKTRNGAACSWPTPFGLVFILSFILSLQTPFHWTR